MALGTFQPDRQFQFIRVNYEEIQFFQRARSPYTFPHGSTSNLTTAAGTPSSHSSLLLTVQYRFQLYNAQPATLRFFSRPTTAAIPFQPSTSLSSRGRSTPHCPFANSSSPALPIVISALASTPVPGQQECKVPLKVDTHARAKSRLLRGQTVTSALESGAAE